MFCIVSGLIKIEVLYKELLDGNHEYTVTLIKAKDLYMEEKELKEPNTYACLQMFSLESSQAYQTSKIKPGTRNPHWIETFSLYVQ
jgi:hypothetical protein